MPALYTEVVREEGLGETVAACRNYGCGTETVGYKVGGDCRLDALQWWRRTQVA